MQRSPALQPLSREHHAALKLAKACERAALSGDAAEVGRICRRAADAWTGALDAHFSMEERMLLPLLEGTPDQPLAGRTRAEHRQLAALLDELQRHDAAMLGRFGRELAAHVRFEERELFPALESRMSKDGK